jgi:hypothetical protein
VIGGNPLSPALLTNPGLEDLHLFVVGAVHESVFVDAAGSVAGQVTLQVFRFTYPGERVAGSHRSGT